MQTTRSNTPGNDLINNPSTRCACMLVLDTSASMAGTPIDQLNIGLQQFIQELQSDELAAYSVEVGVITAGGNVQEALPFTTAESIGSIRPLQADGVTPLGEAVSLALHQLEQRKTEYKRNGVAYYQPWLVIISDGIPTDSWQDAAIRSREMTERKQLVCLPVGVAGADLGTLGAFSNKPAMPLEGLKFQEFFQWLSASMSRVSASNSTTAGVKLNLPSTDPWSSI